MKRRRAISIEALAQALEPSTLPFRGQRHAIGGLQVVSSGPTGRDYGRWLTVIGYRDQFIVVVDSYSARRDAVFSLTFDSPRPLRGDGLHFQTRVSTGTVGIHLLGDYGMRRERGRLELQQSLAQSRFLVALTRDPEASARVVNGWATELTCGGRVFRVMHSNQSRRLRPLGPVQTDALFAVVEWDRRDPTGLVPISEIALRTIQATQLVLGGDAKLGVSAAVDLELRGLAAQPKTK